MHNWVEKEENNINTKKNQHNYSFLCCNAMFEIPVEKKTIII